MLRKRLAVVVETHDRVAFEERPHLVIGLSFVTSGLITFVLTFWGHALGPSAIAAGIIVGMGLCSFGLFGLVRTTISAGEQSGVIEIHRQLGPVRFNSRYPLKDVKKAFERRTPHGNGLRMELVDGRKKNLTLFTEYLSVTREVGILNYFIDRGRKQASRERAKRRSDPS